MKLMNDTRSVFGHTDMWKQSEWFLALLSLLTSFFTVSIVPFTRKDFGENYFSWINLYFGYSIVAGFMFFGNLISAFTRHGSSRLMGVFWLAFIGASLYHRYEISRKNKSGEEWHSSYLGTSLLLGVVPVSGEKIYKFLEPAAVLVVGYFFFRFSGLVGIWLMTGAICLLVNNHLVFYHERQTILAMRDVQIEAKYFSGALAGKPASETAGFVVAESSSQLIHTDSHLSDAFDRLSNDMKNLIDLPHDTAA